MSYIKEILSILLVLNTLGAVLTVFHKPRSITATLAWLLTLLFLPLAGFVIYLFCGRGVDGETIYRFSQDETEQVRALARKINADNLADILAGKLELTTEAEALALYFAHVEESPVTRRNALQFYTDGKEKFDALFADLQAAKKNIHVEYYSFFNDRIGQRFLAILTEKAKEGLEVCLIYDPWGSPGANKRFFAAFTAAGGQVTPFITSKNLLSKTRLNYHLHRKIVVIDGSIGWTGGFNVGDQYLGENKKFGYWRDTHCRIVGTAVFSLQEIFIRDWNASVDSSGDRLTYHPDYFVLPDKHAVGELKMQIVADGPESEEQILKSSFIKMILGAKKSVWMQTPYLIPDDTVITALLIAIRSGIDVRIMIPCMPDHPFIYRATQFYAGYLHKAGAKIYHYQNGFIHAKTIIIDDDLSTFGTTNQDFRSYELNFEVNVFAYDEGVAACLKEFFEADMKNCLLLTDETLGQQSRWLRLKQNFSRLLSPIL